MGGRDSDTDTDWDMQTKTYFVWVAENKRVCRSTGKCPMMLSMSLANLESMILSASSNTAMKQAN